MIVAGYDFSHSAHAAVTRAVEIAATAAHVLHVVCVLDPKHPFPGLPHDGPVDHRYATRVQDALAALIAAELASSASDVRIEVVVHAPVGKPVDQLLEVARSVGADLVVVGSHGLSGLERLLVGSTAERVVREAGCSVEVARTKTYADVAQDVVDETGPDPDEVPPHRYEYADRQLVARVLASR